MGSKSQRKITNTSKYSVASRLLLMPSSNVYVTSPKVPESSSVAVTVNRLTPPGVFSEGNIVKFL